MIDTLHQNIFFYTKDTDKKLKGIFAICYNEYIFFGVEAILKNRNKTDRSQTNDNPNGFVGVYSGGNNYLYTEAILANSWSKGFAYGVGGVAGALIAQDMINKKGIVWDFKNSEFNIFKNCKDYNEFINDNIPLVSKNVKIINPMF